MGLVVLHRDYSVGITVKTAIISDAHVGSFATDHGKLFTFLDNLHCDSLILAGDFFDLWECSPKCIRKNYSNFIDVINKLSQKMKVVYVLGNHDANYEDDKLLQNVPVVTRCEFLSGDRRVMVIHGHEYDTLFWRMTMYPICSLNSFMHDLFGTNFQATHSPDSNPVKRLRRLACEEYSGCQIVIAGHVHCPEKTQVGATEYFNCGDWKVHDTYVIVEDGTAKLVQL